MVDTCKFLGSLLAFLINGMPWEEREIEHKNKKHYDS